MPGDHRAGPARPLTDWPAASEFHRIRQDALTRPCPYKACEAPAGVVCRNRWTGEPLEHQPAHQARTKDG